MHRSLIRQRTSHTSADDEALPAAAVRLARPLARVLRAGVTGIEAAAFWIAALLALVVGHHYEPRQFPHDTSPRTASD